LVEPVEIVGDGEMLGNVAFPRSDAAAIGFGPRRHVEISAFRSAAKKTRYALSLRGAARRRGNLDGVCAPGAGLLRFARNDGDLQAAPRPRRSGNRPSNPLGEAGRSPRSVISAVTSRAGVTSKA